MQASLRECGATTRQVQHCPAHLPGQSQIAFWHRCHAQASDHEQISLSIELSPQSSHHSQRLAAFTIPPVPRGSHQRAKTVKVGFLHLPKEVRVRIYDLAIYDHDRTAVFLPRNHPRKVEPDVDDVDVVWSHEQCIPNAESPPLPQMYQVTTSDPGESAASGCWAHGEDLHTATLRLIDYPGLVVNDLTDHRILEMIGESLNWVLSGEEDAHNAQILVQASDADDLTEDLSGAYDSLNCSCICHLPDWSDSEDEISPGRNGPCSTCVYLDCEDPDGSTRNSWDYMYPGWSQNQNVFSRGEHARTDDYEHFDSEENTGMLYEPKEPAILMVSKQIRAECLPIYYARNTFSWRFQWTDYPSSCEAFKFWAKSITSDNLKLMTKISFEGRHVVEEGVEFSIDLDLLDTYPYFETNVFGDEHETEIADSLNRDMAIYLWLMSQSEDSRPRFTASHLCDLANIFVQAMHRDAGGCLDESATICRFKLNSLF